MLFSGSERLPPSTHSCRLSSSPTSFPLRAEGLFSSQSLRWREVGRNFPLTFKTLKSPNPWVTRAPVPASELDTEWRPGVLISWGLWVLQTDRGWGWSLMFFGLFNEDQTPGFWPKPHSPPPTRSSGDRRDWRTTSREEDFFPPPSPLFFYTSPSSSFSSPSCFHQPLWRPDHLCISAWVHHFIKEAFAQMNSDSNVFLPAPCPYGRQRAQETPRRSSAVSTGTRTLKHVYINLWQDKGSG